VKPRQTGRIAAVILLLLGPLACGLFQPGTSEATPERVVFEDDFSDTQSGWNRAKGPGGESDYADGMYRILVNQSETDIWALSGLDLGDVSIEVNALKVGGDRNNRFGVICRAVDNSNFYSFIISSDGFYGIGKIRDNSYALVGMASLQPSKAILPGSANNQIRADCLGNTLTLYVNGEKLAEVQDSDFSSGDVGLIAGTYEDPGTDIRFDDFIVRGP
jgi:hypothetical protein